MVPKLVEDFYTLHFTMKCVCWKIYWLFMLLQNNQSLNRILSHTNSVHALKYYLFNILQTYIFYHSSVWIIQFGFGVLSVTLLRTAANNILVIYEIHKIKEGERLSITVICQTKFHKYGTATNQLNMSLKCLINSEHSYVGLGVWTGSNTVASN
jgi:hypothetical protein